MKSPQGCVRPVGAISGFGDTHRNSWAVQELQVRAERPLFLRGFQSSNLPRGLCLQIQS